jgi:hypothetical protein
MPWYYAGPDQKPVGPVSLEELQERRRNDLVLAETYIIEWTYETGVVGTWRHYGDVFPSVPPAPVLPPPPAAMATPPPAPPAPASLLPPPAPLGVNIPQSHPLFPSAAHAPLASPTTPVAAPHGHYPVRKTNAWCAWGFGLGIAAFIFSFACGVGLFLAVPGLIVSILGLVQIQRHPDQSGRGLAVTGGILSVLALLIALAFAIWLIPQLMKNHEWTVTEQSSTNSE